MRLHKPVNYQIANTKLGRLRLKARTSLVLELEWDKANEETWVRVQIRRQIGNQTCRHTFAFREALRAEQVPSDLFDSRTFVEELGCDIGKLFSILAAPHSAVGLKLIKGNDPRVRITLTIGNHYEARSEASFFLLEPFLRES